MSKLADNIITMQISIGQKATRTITLTAEHVRTFAALSGDYNPLHFDESFVSKTKFKRLVVQGGLTTGLLHALVAMDMPGPGTVFLSQNWKFTAPVFIGDTIHSEITISEKSDGKKPELGNVTEHVEIINQHGEIVIVCDHLLVVKKKS